MDLKEFYNSLSEDVKAKLKECKSEEEMLKVLEEENIKLDPDVLEDVSGGRLHPGEERKLKVDREFLENNKSSC